MAIIISQTCGHMVFDLTVALKVKGSQFLPRAWTRASEPYFIPALPTVAETWLSENQGKKSEAESGIHHLEVMNICAAYTTTSTLPGAMSLKRLKRAKMEKNTRQHSHHSWLFMKIKKRENDFLISTSGFTSGSVVWNMQTFAKALM